MADRVALIIVALIAFGLITLWVFAKVFKFLVWRDILRDPWKK